MASVLVVDDDDAERELGRRLMLTAGHLVHTVADGAQAVAALEQTSYDLLITDIYMPVMDGMTLLAHCRERYPQLSLLAVSGGDIVADQRKLQASGLFDTVELVAKPYKIEDLRAAITRALGMA
jgi:two-component system cell cycle response regulator CpdR